jgi:hypothetical protein
MSVGGSNAYNQSAGTTTVDGTLTGSAAISVTGGSVLGAGKLAGNVTIGGTGTAPTISAGDSGKAGLLAITSNYTQLSTATMNSFIGGTTVGTQYSQLQVGGTASLAGTLTVTLASGFTPTIGSAFTVLTAAKVTGAFSDSTIAINGTEHFNVSYTSTGVVLTVASGPVPLSGRLSQPALVAALSRKPQPVLMSPLRNGVRLRPGGSDRFLVAAIGHSQARSGALLGGKYGLSGQQSPSHMPAQVAAIWQHKPSFVMPPIVAAAARLPVSRQRTMTSVSPASSWSTPARAVSMPRSPVTAGMTMRRMPARISLPMMPRLGR